MTVHTFPLMCSAKLIVKTDLGYFDYVSRLSLVRLVGKVIHKAARLAGSFYTQLTQVIENKELIHYRTKRNVIALCVATSCVFFQVDGFASSAARQDANLEFSPRPLQDIPRVSPTKTLYVNLTKLSKDFGPINLGIIEQIESSGRARAVGDGGLALGLHQLHAGVIKDYNRAHKTSYAHKDALNPQISHKIASWYMNQEIPRLLRHFKLPVTPRNILRAYNAGILSVKQGRTPRVTQAYLDKYVRLGGTL